MSQFFSTLNIFSPKNPKEWEAHLTGINKMYSDAGIHGIKVSSKNACHSSESIAQMRFFGYDCAEDLAKLDEPVGTGECVALIQNYVSGIGLTKTWVPGPRVADLSESAIPSGTVIATFWNGKYPNKKSGNHAAFYLSHSTKGIKVVEQWHGKSPKAAKAARNVDGIRFRNTALPSDQSGSMPAMTNTAEYYYVVLDRR